jgi:uncharacterized MAPEG superfamily protein
MPRPSSNDWQNLLYSYAACTLILAVKFQICQFIGANHENHPSEDEKLMGAPPDIPEEVRKRRFRQAANDVENIPWNMIIFWSAFIIQNYLSFSPTKTEGRDGTRALSGLIILYTFSRIIYTLCYLFAWQPFRSIFFILGMLCTLCAAAISMYAASKIDASDYFP